MTIALAVRELDGSTRLGARTTFFRLGDDPGLARFVDAMAKRAGGTVVAPETDDLGAAVIGSYLGSRRNGAFGGWGRDEDVGDCGRAVGAQPDRAAGPSPGRRPRRPG